MDLEIRKNLASNWFKTLQESLCHKIYDLEKKSAKFEITSWKRNYKKDEGGGGSVVVVVAQWWWWWWWW